MKFGSGKEQDIQEVKIYLTRVYDPRGSEFEDIIEIVYYNKIRRNLNPRHEVWMILWYIEYTQNSIGWIN